MDQTLVSRIADLPPEKRARLLQALKEQKSGAASQQIPPQSRTSLRFPLSFAQERLWFLHQVDPASPRYTIPGAVRCRGPLNPMILEQCFNELIRRHEVLRTTFTTVEGRPMQVIAPSLDRPLLVEDLCHVAPAVQSAVVEQRIADEACRPFDLEQGPLVRLTLLLLNDAEHIQLLTLHHIIADAWSVGMLIRELWTLYEAAISGQPALLPTPPIQYADYAVWQRDQFAAGVFAQQQAYWVEQLGGTLPLLELPTDHPRPAAQTFRGAVETIELPVNFTAALKDFSQSEGCTLFMTLLAAFQTLLYRYTAQEDILVGSPMSNRPHAELEGVIGCFVNMLVLRTRLTGQQTFRELLRTVRLVALAAYEHQDMPFEYLVEILRPTRTASRSPLFQVSFGRVDDPMAWLAPDRTIEIIPLETHTGTAKFDLTFEVMERADGSVLVTAEYSTELFDKMTIQSMLVHFQTLLEGIVANPDQTITALPLLSAPERQRQLVQWNQTATVPLPVLPVHRRFEQQAQASPGATAVTITRSLQQVYTELESMANSPATLDTLSGIYAPTALVEDQATSETDNPDSTHQLHTGDIPFAGCCFKHNPFTHRFSRHVLQNTIQVDADDLLQLNLLRTHAQNLVVVDNKVLDLLGYFDGENNLQSIALRLDGPTAFRMGFVSIDHQSDKLKLNHVRFQVDHDERTWVPLIKALASANLLELVAYKYENSPGEILTFRDVIPDKVVNEEPSGIQEDVPQVHHPDKGPVLLLGETTGTASIGLAYLAAYLWRHGIEAYCQLNDFSLTGEHLRQKVVTLLERFTPKVVGVSLKWFPHMARALEICKYIKEYSSTIRVVLGGDTASYFAQQLIQYDTIDYVVIGDGEGPLLAICLDATEIPNCLSKRDGQVQQTPITYQHNQQSFAKIYLSHLDKIFVSPADPSLSPYLFIFTGRGCPMNCHYCGGARDVQIQAFQRPKPYAAIRGIAEARHDIIHLKRYTSTFLFDFDTPTFDSLENYTALWEGIDLTDHFGYFYFWYLPSPDFIELVVRTFKYVYLNIDLNSLSERHRLQLSSQRFGKPQPHDAEILDFFAICDQYNNVEVTINLINGLPSFTEDDIVSGQRLLSRLLDQHRSFVGLGWGRLHAQPGAPMTQHYAKWGMRESAKTFEDFLHYSQLNMQERHYPDLATLHYPMVYYQDDYLNAKVSKYYVDTMRQIKEQLGRRRMRVTHGTEALTYAELNARANQLAHYLQRLGVGPEVRVGIHLERSVELVIAILAVFKAGGAYVPLDPTYPTARRQFMTADAGVTVLITQAWLVQDWAIPRPLVLCLAEQWADITSEEPTNLDAEVTGTHLAYILYTSGSTGQPKGVMVQHQGIGNLAEVQQAIFGMHAASRVLQFAPLSFDASVSEIWVTLLAGATLCLAPQEVLLPGPALIDLLEREAISVVTLPPSFQVALPERAFPALATLVSAGEACRPELVARWSPGRRFINAYGPTEATVCATMEPGSVPHQPAAIGHPIANVQVYLLDRSGQPVPIGVPGELFIGGIGLARGYVNRPDLTAARFVPHPFSLEPGARLYRTGDLGVFRRDGTIVFLGRADHQVKVRGMRVELGEIETVLGQHAAVRAAVVTSHALGDEQRLVAYLVPHPGQEPSTSALRSFIAAKLPDYMVPATFMLLDAMPLMPNGKVDRQALPAPNEQRPDLEEPYLPPATAVEAVIAAVWATCLRVESVGIHDNFFELGGYSLLITQVLSRIRAVFQAELPTRTFLDAPTVAGLARELISREAQPGQMERIAQLHLQVSAMSPEEVHALLHEKQPGRRVTFNGF